MRQRTISDSFWHDPEIYDLSQEDKATLLYFLTSPGSNIIGVYQIVWAIAAAEMGWTKDQMVIVANRLKTKGLIDFDNAGWVWVKIWWKHNSAKGAFSPKLIENAKKQLTAMPFEWLDNYMISLEKAGLDGVSIGYLYPTDTLPPNTNTNCIYNTTTTTSLIFPAELNSAEKKSVTRLLLEVEFLGLDQQQELLDELAGAINTKSIKTNRVAFFSSLVASVKKTPFIPARGAKVFEARQNQKKAVGKQKIELDPAAMQRGGEMINIPARLRRG